MALSVLTPRDAEILTALSRGPLATGQLLRLSASFAAPFRNERVLRRRLTRLAECGLVRRSQYRALADTVGMPNYYLLTSMGNQILNGPETPVPSKRFGLPVAPAMERHTYALSEVVVHTVLAARRAGASMTGFCRENSVQLTDGSSSVYPDAAFQLVTAGGERYSYFVEVDNGSERLVSMTQDETWTRKIQVYEAVRARISMRFRVLVFATRSVERLSHILSLAAEHASNPDRTLFCGTTVQVFLGCDDALTVPLFMDHRRRTISLFNPPIAAGRTPGAVIAPHAALDAIALSSSVNVR